MPSFEREISLQTEWHQVETLHEGFLSSNIYVLFVLEAHSTVLLAEWGHWMAGYQEACLRRSDEAGSTSHR